MRTNLQPEAPDRAALLRVGDIAKATGKTVRAIHLYEELGLLQPATRSSGGFRLFDASAVDRVRWIDSLHVLGFSLQEMREVLQNWWMAEQGPTAMAELRELFLRKLDQTREALRRHQHLVAELEEGLRYLETCQTCEAPGTVHVCVNCQQDHGGASAPSLVAGIHGARTIALKPSRPAFVRVEDMKMQSPGSSAGADSAHGAASRKEQQQ
jgi:DNA-binding transcriptional MerR regulator